MTGGTDLQIPGYVNPKYLIVGVTYAPPGGSASSVSYQSTSIAGNTSTITGSFTNAESVSVKVSATESLFGVIKGKTTATVSRGWTQKMINANAITIQKTASTTLKTPGVPNVYSPVNHDYDYIWLWLNPVALFTIDETGGSVIWNGYGYDLNDPLQDVDVWPVYVGYLNGDFGPLDPQDAGALSRPWASTQTFGPGQGPGITVADFPNILKADPFASNPYDANSGYVLTLDPESNPATSTDGRFTAATPANTTPQSIPYAQAGPNSTQAPQSTYQNTYSTITQVTKTSDYSYTTGFGLEQSFDASLFGTGLSADLNSNWNLTWENISQSQNTSTDTQTDTAVITGPPCPAMTAPCNPVYTEPHEFAIYQDNLYGTFMFWPNPYFSISKVAPATNTVTAGTAATYTVSTLANAGYRGTSITFNVVGLPAGASVTPGTVVPGNPFALSITTTVVTPAGSYPLTIVATDGSQSYFAYATMVVSSAAPGGGGSVGDGSGIASGSTLTELTPSAAAIGMPDFQLAATGTGFSSGSQIAWNGQPLSSTLISATQLSAAVPATLIAAAGFADITVVNQGGLPSNTAELVVGTLMSIAHTAVGGTYTADLLALNTASSPASYSAAFLNDQGVAVALPVGGVGAASRISSSIPGYGLSIYEAANPSVATLSGSALLATDPAIASQIRFRNHAQDGNYYEAAVPAQIGAREYILLFDATTFSANGAQIFTGLAIANLDSATAADISCVARDSNGSVIAGAVSPPLLPPGGHWAEYQFPALVGVRGTLDCSANTLISIIGLRFLGDYAFSSLPVITHINPAAGPSVVSELPHYAVGGSYTTDLFLINSSDHAAPFSITFRDDSGNPVQLPVASLGTVSTIADIVPARGVKFYEAGSPNGPTLQGSVMISADPAVTAHELFRNLSIDGTYYEAAVHSGAGASGFIMPFDATTFAPTNAQIFTGIAIANLDSTNGATVTCTARVADGIVIPNAVAVPVLPPMGHWASYQFPALIGKQGTLDCTSTTKVTALGLHFLGYSAFSSVVVTEKGN